MFEPHMTCQVILPVVIKPTDGSPYPHLETLQPEYSSKNTYLMTCGDVVIVTSVMNRAYDSVFLDDREIGRYIEHHCDAYLLAKFRREYIYDYLEVVTSTMQIDDTFNGGIRHNLIEVCGVIDKPTTFYRFVVKDHCLSSSDFKKSELFKNMIDNSIQYGK